MSDHESPALRSGDDAAALSAIFCTGQLAGMMLAVAFTQRAAQALPEASWTLRQQTDDGAFRKIMPIAFSVTAISLVLARRSSDRRSRASFDAAAGLVLAVVVETLAVNVPINVRVREWTAGSTVVDWTKERDRWLAGHYLRTAAGSLAFVCTLLASRRRREADAGS